MKKYFGLNLNGDQCWKPILAGWFIGLISSVVSSLNRLPDAIHPESLRPGTGAMMLWLGLFTFSANVIITFILIRTVTPTVSLDNTRFDFFGSIGDYLKVSAKGLLISIITLGLYTPWLYRNQLRYLTSCFKINSNEVNFNGRPASLLKSALLTLLVLVLIFGVVALAFILLAGRRYELQFNDFRFFDMNPAIVPPGAFVVLVVLIIIACLSALVVIGSFISTATKWFLSLSSDSKELGWTADRIETGFYLLGQLLFFIITLGIAWPFIAVNLYRYYVSHIVVRQNGQVVHKYGFDTEVHFFRFLWKQLLLCIFTIGLYLPWAYSAVGAMFAKHSYIEDTDIPNPQDTVQSQASGI